MIKRMDIDNTIAHKIKKLAEYAMKPYVDNRIERLLTKTSESPTITIDHNDYELIGEFL